MTLYTLATLELLFCSLLRRSQNKTSRVAAVYKASLYVRSINSYIPHRYLGIECLRKPETFSECEFFIELLNTLFVLIFARTNFRAISRKNDKLREIAEKLVPKTARREGVRENKSARK